jgi:glycogen operon protein
MAFRLSGSPDIYQKEEREPEQSINFVTCHDGFTLNDLISFDSKHNEANGEGNRDGTDHNLSWNCGVEGPTEDPEVERLRSRQVKNFLTLTLLAIGTPMLLMGDEFGAPKVATTTPSARTTKSPGSTGHWSRSTRMFTALSRRSSHSG